MDELEKVKNKAEIERLRRVASKLDENDSVRKALLERASMLEKRA